jgi:hypothetical protein
MSQVKFKIGDIEINSEWNETPTARKLLEALPFDGTGNYWGAEFYFEVPVKTGYEQSATEVVDPGTVAYWPAGHCLCLFWGPTPASKGDECRAASKVNIVGRVENPEALAKLKARSVHMEVAE